MQGCMRDSILRYYPPPGRRLQDRGADRAWRTGRARARGWARGRPRALRSGGRGRSARCACARTSTPRGRGPHLLPAPRQKGGASTAAKKRQRPAWRRERAARVRMGRTGCGGISISARMASSRGNSWRIPSSTERSSTVSLHVQRATTVRTRIGLASGPCITCEGGPQVNTL